MGGAENVYWVFSAAAQTVAAFVAFLLAGYALVQGLMDAAAQNDETLLEIQDSLKQRYHSQLSALVVTTALSIGSCLGVVFLNVYDSQWVVVLAWVAAGLTGASIFGGVVFVISIVDPKKYRKAAQRLAAEVRASPTGEGSATSSEFFVRFVDLERAVRDLWERRTDGERVSRRQGPASFREMVESLARAEALPFDLYERLLGVSRHRNLVFHGHVNEVDREILDDLARTQAAVVQLRNAA